MNVMQPLLLAVWLLMLVGFLAGMWPFDGQPGQFSGALLCSSALTFALFVLVVL